jgi:hypothetical protein
MYIVLSDMMYYNMEVRVMVFNAIRDSLFLYSIESPQEEFEDTKGVIKIRI